MGIKARLSTCWGKLKNCSVDCCKQDIDEIYENSQVESARPSNVASPNIGLSPDNIYCIHVS